MSVDQAAATRVEKLAAYCERRVARKEEAITRALARVDTVSKEEKAGWALTRTGRVDAESTRQLVAQLRALPPETAVPLLEALTHRWSEHPPLPG